MPDPDGARSAAALLVECLAAEGCAYVFSVPGEETMNLLEALAGSPSVRHVTTRHEQATTKKRDAEHRS